MTSYYKIQQYLAWSVNRSPYISLLTPLVHQELALRSLSTERGSLEDIAGTETNTRTPEEEEEEEERGNKKTKEHEVLVVASEQAPSSSSLINIIQLRRGPLQLASWQERALLPAGHRSRLRIISAWGLSLSMVDMSPDSRSERSSTSRCRLLM